MGDDGDNYDDDDGDGDDEDGVRDDGDNATIADELSTTEDSGLRAIVQLPKIVKINLEGVRKSLQSFRFCCCCFVVVVEISNNSTTATSA